MENSFKHSKTFRYELINNHANCTKVLFALHGYGQLARFFGRKLEGLPNDVMIVAPEGMHRFYTQGNYGRVGASWMTKEAREVDIADNIEWLNKLNEIISQEYPIEERFLLGFSQGGSTAIRWALHGEPSFQAIIIWASDFPPEEYNNAEQLSESQLYFCIGSNDEYFDNDSQKKLIELYQRFGFKISAYIGTHEIQKSTLLEIFNQIR